MALALLMSFPFCRGVDGVIAAFPRAEVKTLVTALHTGTVHRLALIIFDRDRVLTLDDRLLR